MKLLCLCAKDDDSKEDRSNLEAIKLILRLSLLGKRGRRLLKL